MTSSRLKVDIAIVGAGLAGLWLAHELRQRGLSIAICEATAIGGVQSVASQGIIHGGLKYALLGRPNAASEVLANMPQRWRSIPSIPILADRFHLWVTGAAASSARLTGFLASKLLADRVRALSVKEYPEPFRRALAGGTVHPRGRLFELDEMVVDVPALVRQMAGPHGDHILPIEVTPAKIVRDADAGIIAIRDRGVELIAQRYVFTAGASNARLTGCAGQLRPLRQIIVRVDAAQPIFAHCVRGIAKEPALTITTHGNSYYLGGRIATRFEASAAAQRVAARKELERCLPWLDWRQADFEVFEVDRAEAHAGGHRPETAAVLGSQNWLACWPTKLALLPAMADQAIARLADVVPCADGLTGGAASALPFAKPPF